MSSDYLPFLQLLGLFLILSLLYKYFSKEGYENEMGESYKPTTLAGQDTAAVAGATTAVLPTSQKQEDRLKPHLSRPRLGGINKLDGIGKDPNYLMFHTPTKRLSPGKGLPIYKSEVTQQSGLFRLYNNSPSRANMSIEEQAL